MSNLLPILSDMIVIVFDLLFYSIMSPMRKNTKIPGCFVFIGCAAIVAAYFSATYILNFPAAISSAGCMSIPSFLLFLYFAKYRDSRFILTFCFVDTISLIVAFIGRLIGIVFPYGEYCAIIIMLVLFLTLLRLGWKYAAKYQKLLDQTDTGWGLMALSAGSIYFAMIFFAGYPSPLIERQEYIPTWFVFALVVVLYYIVFIHSILKTKKIQEQNVLLKREKEIYQMAYRDGLTGLRNRASYMEKLNNLERNRESFSNVGFLVFDVNNFKSVNDTLGHYIGDQVLIAAAAALNSTFCGYDEAIFRMGGDEFLVILPDIAEEKIRELIGQFHVNFEKEQEKMKTTVTAAVGYEIISSGDERLLDAAYIMADKKMYVDKQR